MKTANETSERLLEMDERSKSDLRSMTIAQLRDMDDTMSGDFFAPGDREVLVYVSKLRPSGVLVFLSFARASDGQRGYINPDGASPVGKPWNAASA